jgi:hypothetical protein
VFLASVINCFQPTDQYFQFLLFCALKQAIVVYYGCQDLQVLVHVPSDSLGFSTHVKYTFVHYFLRYRLGLL